MASSDATAVVRVLTATVAASLLSGAALHATTLAIIRTPDQVIIAADSLLVWHGGDRRSQLTCKLDTQDDVIFAMAGLVVSPDNDFDAHALVTTVLSTPGTLEARAQVLERLVRGQLLGTLTRIQQELPRLFDEQLESGFVLNVTLAAVREEVALLEIRDFYAETAADGTLGLRVARVSCPRDCPRPTEVFGVGETAAMMQHLGTLPDLSTDLPALAEELVKIEIANRPALVGPPVDVLRVGTTAHATRSAAARPRAQDVDTSTTPRRGATPVPRGVGLSMSVALLLGVLAVGGNRSGLLRRGVLIAVGTALIGGYMLMIPLSDAKQPSRETGVEADAGTASRIEWLRRKPACVG